MKSWLSSSARRVVWWGPGGLTSMDLRAKLVTWPSVYSQTPLTTLCYSNCTITTWIATEPLLHFHSLGPYFLWNEGPDLPLHKNYNREGISVSLKHLKEWHICLRQWTDGTIAVPCVDFQQAGCPRPPTKWQSHCCVQWLQGAPSASFSWLTSIPKAGKISTGRSDHRCLASDLLYGCRSVSIFEISLWLHSFN